MAAAADGGAALGVPRPNPKGDGPTIPSPPGKGKPVALADITNTGRPSTTRSVSIADVVKENAKLRHLLSEKTRIIEVSRVEMQKLHGALQSSRQQNLQLAQANSQMLAELNMGKDKLKALQHELSCTTALLKVKDSELEQKKAIVNQWRKEGNSQVMAAKPSNDAAVEAHQIDAAVASNIGFREQDTTKKRRRNKQKSGSSGCIDDTSMPQDHCGPHLHPIESLDEDLRKPLRRRSSRLNPSSSDVTEVFHKTLLEDNVVSSAPCTSSVETQHAPNTGKHTAKSLQNKCSEIAHEVVLASEFKKIKTNEPQKKAKLKEMQEACSRVSGVESHQDPTLSDSDTGWSQLAETQSSLSLNISEPAKPPEDTGNKRKSRRGQSARLNSLTTEDTKSNSETLKDVNIPLANSSSDALMEQQTNQRQNDACSSMKPSEGQVVGRRSVRGAAAKVASYKEIPLNVKMRRP